MPRGWALKPTLPLKSRVSKPAIRKRVRFGLSIVTWYHSSVVRPRGSVSDLGEYTHDWTRAMAIADTSAVSLGAMNGSCATDVPTMWSA